MMGAPFDYALAERLAGKIIDSTDAHTVMEMLGLERMDLVSEGVTRAFRDWDKFDPAKAQPQTFMHPRINAGIFDYLRKEGSQDRRIKGMAGLNPRGDKDRELCDWLKEVYEAAKRTYISPRHRQGRRLHAAPQIAAIADLMRHLQLSCRGCARLLATREDIRDVLHLKSLPSYRWIWEASKLANVVTYDAEIGAEVVTLAR